MSITIYHNPDCGTSRNTLALIRNSGAEPTVIYYLETPPSGDELRQLLAAMGIPVRALLESIACLVFLPGAWRYAARREVTAMAAGAILAVPIGSLILAHSDPVALRWGLTVLVLVAVAVLASGWRYRGRDSVPLTVGVGALGGVMSGAAMLGGVPPAVWWLGRSATARVLRASMNLYFVILTVAIVAAFAWRGLFTGSALWLALAAGPAYGAGLWAGSALFGLASETTFRRTAYGLILAAAVLGLPLWDPLTGR